MPVLTAQTLREFARSLLEAVGTPPAIARFVGDSLADANLAGHDSHGIIRLLHYIEIARAGQVDPRGQPCVARQVGATAVIDGAWGWGQPAMMLATETVIALARANGVGAATVVRCYHVGRVAPYVEAIAREGMVGLAMANAGPAVAPYGAKTRVLGTNPIAWAAPRAAGKEPVCLDIATAAIAEGKLRVARAKGETVPLGMIVDAEGYASNEPNDFYHGGALLPFGAHKGSGLSLLAQLLGRGLAGMTPDSLREHRGANGPFVLALDVAAFTPVDRFIAAVEEQCAEIKASATADGFTEVLVPGEPEVAARRRREAEGIPVPERTWQDLQAVANELGVTAPLPSQATTPSWLEGEGRG
jgi:uncharacterized oxidoreductase